MLSSFHTLVLLFGFGFVFAAAIRNQTKMGLLGYSDLSLNSTLLTAFFSPHRSSIDNVEFNWYYGIQYSGSSCEDSALISWNAVIANQCLTYRNSTGDTEESSKSFGSFKIICSNDNFIQVAHYEDSDCTAFKYLGNSLMVNVCEIYEDGQSYVTDYYIKHVCSHGLLNLAPKQAHVVQRSYYGADCSESNSKLLNQQGNLLNFCYRDADMSGSNIEYYSHMLTSTERKDYYMSGDCDGSQLPADWITTKPITPDCVSAFDPTYRTDDDGCDGCTETGSYVQWSFYGIDLGNKPTYAPNFVYPSFSPSFSPALPTKRPTVTPSALPSTAPSMLPSPEPTLEPATSIPTIKPTLVPTLLPTSRTPTITPSTRAPSTRRPTVVPTTRMPTVRPTTSLPTTKPTFTPSWVLTYRYFGNDCTKHMDIVSVEATKAHECLKYDIDDNGKVNAYGSWETICLYGQVHQRFYSDVNCAILTHSVTEGTDQCIIRSPRYTDDAYYSDNTELTERYEVQCEETVMPQEVELYGPSATQRLYAGSDCEGPTIIAVRSYLTDHCYQSHNKSLEYSQIIKSNQIAYLYNNSVNCNANNDTNQAPLLNVLNANCSTNNATDPGNGVLAVLWAGSSQWTFKPGSSRPTAAPTSLGNIPRPPSLATSHNNTLKPSLAPGVVSAPSSIVQVPIWRQLPSTYMFITAVTNKNGSIVLAATKNNSQVLLSRDAGLWWTVMNIGNKDHCQAAAMSITDTTNLMIVSCNTTVFVSLDGGNTWMRDTKLPKSKWNSVFMSANGDLLGVNAHFAVLGINTSESVGGLYLSRDSGVTWALALSLPHVNTIAAKCSYDGKLLVALAQPGAIYISTDGGYVWSESTAPKRKYWQDISMSPDASVLVAVTLDGEVFASFNRGNTWRKPFSFQQPISKVCVSGDGSRAMIIAESGNIYVSMRSDFSQWTASAAPASSWKDLTCAFDSLAAYAIDSHGLLYTTSNTAVLESVRTPYPTRQPTGLSNTSSAKLWPISKWDFVASHGIFVFSAVSSRDGSVLVLSTSDGIKISLDGGSTLTDPTSTDVTVLHPSCDQMAMSYDKQTLVCASYSSIYVSSDAAKTWTLSDTPPVGRWGKVACTHNGGAIFAVSATGYIEQNTNGGVFVSYNLGVNWNLFRYFPSDTYLAVGCSYDGAVIVVVSATGSVFVTQSGGDHWEKSDSQVGTNSIKIAVSDNAEVIALVSDDGRVYISLNIGAFFNVTLTDGGLTNIYMSVTGDRIVVVSRYQGLYMSGNYGKTWLVAGANLAYGDISFVLGNMDLSSMVAISNGGNIYNSIGITGNTPSYTPTIAPTGTTLSPTSPGRLTVVPKWTYVNTVTFQGGLKQILSSENGDVVVLLTSYNRLLLAHNGSLQFTNALPGGNTYAMCMSRHGDIIVTFTDYDVYVSMDSGANWTTTPSPTGYYLVNFACSQSAEVIIATPNGYSGRGVLISVDYGQSWSYSAVLTAVVNIIACSSDCKVIIAVELLNVYISTDRAESWRLALVSSQFNNWDSVALSGDGSVIVGASSRSGVYISRNTGASWTLYSYNSVSQVLCSDTGATIVLVYNNGVSMSLDFGATWNNMQTASGPATSSRWFGVAGYGDLTNMLGVKANGYLYQLQPVPSPFPTTYPTQTPTVRTLAPTTQPTTLQSRFCSVAFGDISLNCVVYNLSTLSATQCTENYTEWDVTEHYPINTALILIGSVPRTAQHCNLVASNIAALIIFDANITVNSLIVQNVNNIMLVESEISVNSTVSVTNHGSSLSLQFNSAALTMLRAESVHTAVALDQLPRLLSGDVIVLSGHFSTQHGSMNISTNGSISVKNAAFTNTDVFIHCGNFSVKGDVTVVGSLHITSDTFTIDQTPQATSTIRLIASFNLIPEFNYSNMMLSGGSSGGVGGCDWGTTKNSDNCNAFSQVELYRKTTNILSSHGTGTSTTSMLYCGRAGGIFLLHIKSFRVVNPNSYGGPAPLSFSADGFDACETFDKRNNVPYGGGGSGGTIHITVTGATDSALPISLSARGGAGEKSFSDILTGGGSGGGGSIYFINTGLTVSDFSENIVNSGDSTLNGYCCTGLPGILSINNLNHNASDLKFTIAQSDYSTFTLGFLDTLRSVNSEITFILFLDDIVLRSVHYVITGPHLNSMILYLNSVLSGNLTVSARLGTVQYNQTIAITPPATVTVNVLPNNTAIIHFSDPVFNCHTNQPPTVSDFEITSSRGHIKLLRCKSAASGSNSDIVCDYCNTDSSVNASLTAVFQNKPNRLCYKSSHNSVFHLPVQRRLLQLAHFSPTTGNEYGNDFITITPQYNISDRLSQLQSELNSLSAWNASRENVTVLCQFGPAIHPHISIQHPVYTQTMFTSLNSSSTENKFVCLSAQANPMMPYNMDAFREVQLWIRYESSVTKSHIASEYYGTFTIKKAPIGHDNDLKISLDNSLTLPGSSFVIDTNSTSKMVFEVNFVATNSTLGPLIDVNPMYQACRLDNGSMLVTMRNFTESRINGSNILDYIAHVYYNKIGAFVAYAHVTTVDVGLYLKSCQNNVSTVESDVQWCNGRGVVERSPLFTLEYSYGNVTDHTQRRLNPLVAAVVVVATVAAVVALPCLVLQGGMLVISATDVIIPDGLLAIAALIWETPTDHDPLLNGGKRRKLQLSSDPDWQENNEALWKATKEYAKELLTSVSKAKAELLQELLKDSELFQKALADALTDLPAKLADDAENVKRVSAEVSSAFLKDINIFAKCVENVATVVGKVSGYVKCYMQDGTTMGECLCNLWSHDPDYAVSDKECIVEGEHELTAYQRKMQYINNPWDILLSMIDRFKEPYFEKILMKDKNGNIRPFRSQQTLCDYAKAGTCDNSATVIYRPSTYFDVSTKDDYGVSDNAKLPMYPLHTSQKDSIGFIACCVVSDSCGIYRSKYTICPAAPIKYGGGGTGGGSGGSSGAAANNNWGKAIALNDVHFVTMTGIPYTFNGYGEFWYIDSERIKLQGRHRGFIPGCKRSIVAEATLIYGLALSVEYETGKTVNITITSGMEKPTVIYTTTDQPFIHYVQPMMRLRVANIDIMFDNQLTITIDTTLSFIVEQVTTSPVDVGFLKVRFTTDMQYFYNNTVGLLGSVNQYMSQTFMLHDGTIPVRSYDSLLDIHHKFGMKMQTTAQNSIFLYNEFEGDSWVKHVCSEFNFYNGTLSSILTADQISFARTHCADRVHPSVLEECIVEIGLMVFNQGVDLQQITSDMVGMSEDFEVQQFLLNAPPVFISPPVQSAYVYKVNSMFNTTFIAVDPQQAEVVVLKAEYLPTNSTFNATTGEFFWLSSAESSEYVNISAHNGVAASFYILTLQPYQFPTSQPSSQPSGQPSQQPSGQPTVQPSGQPSSTPSHRPSAQPSTVPTSQPTVSPTSFPSSQPTTTPTNEPTSQPSVQPSTVPTSQPSNSPSVQPSKVPSQQPTSLPSCQPSTQPTSSPTSEPTSQPSLLPSAQPTHFPSTQPTNQPSSDPSAQPSSLPSGEPSSQPSAGPSGQPTTQPTNCPSAQPSGRPTKLPTAQPSARPTTQPSLEPSSQPTRQPSTLPTSDPSAQPSTVPSCQPSGNPSAVPSSQPSQFPTSQPSSAPTGEPTTQPTSSPSGQPFSFPSSIPTCQPSRSPTDQPTCQPSGEPTSQPSNEPSLQPTAQPSSHPSLQPAAAPSSSPSNEPSGFPTAQPNTKPTTCPSGQPTSLPSSQPTSQPSRDPSVQPSTEPSVAPTGQPSSLPSAQPQTVPTSTPSRQPTTSPSSMPTSQPSGIPSKQPSAQPTSAPQSPSSRPSSTPSVQPTASPSGEPSMQPSSAPTSPTSQPSGAPSIAPSSLPSSQPSISPSGEPTAQPSARPSTLPSIPPTCRPTAWPSVQPSGIPTANPSTHPTTYPSNQPSCSPSLQPTRKPSSVPTTTPSSPPSIRPIGQPSAWPTTTPSTQPSSAPSCQPTTGPSTQPSSQPSGLPLRQPLATKRPTMQPTTTSTAAPSCVSTCCPSTGSVMPTVASSTLSTAVLSVTPSKEPLTSAKPSQIQLTTKQPTVAVLSDKPTTMPSCGPTVATHSSAHPSSRQPTTTPTIPTSTLDTDTPSLQPTSSRTSMSISPTVETTTTPTAAAIDRPAEQLVQFDSEVTFNGMSSAQLNKYELKVIEMSLANSMQINASTVNITRYVVTSVSSDSSSVLRKRKELGSVTYTITVFAITSINTAYFQDVAGNGTLLFQQLTTKLNNAMISGNLTSAMVSIASQMSAELNITTSTQFSTTMSLTITTSRPLITVVSVPTAHPTVIPHTKNNSSKPSGLSDGMLAVVIVLPTIGVCLIAMCCCWFCKKRRGGSSGNSLPSISGVGGALTKMVTESRI